MRFLDILYLNKQYKGWRLLEKWVERRVELPWHGVTTRHSVELCSGDPQTLRAYKALKMMLIHTLSSS